MIPREAAVAGTEDAVATEVAINSHTEVDNKGSGRTVLATTTEAARGTKHSNKKAVRRAVLRSLERIRTLTARTTWSEVAIEVDHAEGTAGGAADIASTTRMPSRQREASRLEIDLKGRPKKVDTEVAIVVVEDAADIVETVLIDRREQTHSGETSQPKVPLLMLKAVLRKIDLPESTIRQKKVKKVEIDLLTDLESTSNMILERIR
jgi:hypothetical protein